MSLTEIFFEQKYFLMLILTKIFLLSRAISSIDVHYLTFSLERKVSGIFNKTRSFDSSKLKE